jgi:hypothetical protein
MNRLHTWVGLGCVLATGCVTGSKEIGATAGSTEGTAMTSTTAESSESGETGVSMSSTSASSSATGSTESTGTDSATQGETTQGETTQGETTSGQVGSCEEAQSQGACEAASNEFETCGWVPTVVYAGGDQCMEIVVGTEGECVLVAQEDSCTGAEFSTCPDGETRVYFRELGLEIGAIELVAFDSSFECEESAAAFEPCVMIEGDPVTYEPPECGCACPA